MMSKQEQRTCKTKACANPALFDEKYCRNCAAKRKESRDGLLAMGTGAVTAGVAVVTLPKKFYDFYGHNEGVFAPAVEVVVKAFKK